jgi:hypothetical protein
MTPDTADRLPRQQHKHGLVLLVVLRSPSVRGSLLTAQRTILADALNYLVPVTNSVADQFPTRYNVFIPIHGAPMIPSHHPANYVPAIREARSVAAAAPGPFVGLEITEPTEQGLK